MVEAHSSKDVETEGVQVILFFLFPWLHHWRGKNNNPWGTLQKPTTSPSCLFTLSSFSHFLATDFPPTRIDEIRSKTLQQISL